MKTMRSLFLIFFLQLLSFQTYAHDKPHHDTAQKGSATDTIVQTQITTQSTQVHSQEEVITNFPNYHPLVVHFPIVLLIVAMLFQLLSFLGYKKELSLVTLILLSLGAISAWLASNTFHAHTGELAGTAKTILEEHEQFASYTWWFAFTALIAKTISHFFLNRKLWIEIAVSLLLVASAITVSVAGHHGAQLVHIEGVGVKGKFLETEHHDH